MFWSKLIKRRKSIKKHSKHELLEMLEGKGYFINKDGQNVQTLIKDDGISVEKITISQNSKDIKYKHLIKQRGNKNDSHMNPKITVISFDVLNLLNEYVECIESEQMESVEQ